MPIFDRISLTTYIVTDSDVPVAYRLTIDITSSIYWGNKYSILLPNPLVFKVDFRGIRI